VLWGISPCTPHCRYLATEIHLMNNMNLFPRPAEWNVGLGPRHLNSIDEAICAIQMWLAVTPDLPLYRALRQRMLTVLEMLLHVRTKPVDADLASAKLALKGLVRYARTVEAHQRAAGTPPRTFNHVTH
jgi:hypothetical protein